MSLKLSLLLLGLLMLANRTPHQERQRDRQTHEVKYIVQSWQVMFDNLLQDASTKRGANLQPVFDLKNGPACRVDLRRDYVLQKHGQGLLGGIQVQSTDPPQAQKKYILAVQE